MNIYNVIFLMKYSIHIPSSSLTNFFQSFVWWWYEVASFLSIPTPILGMKVQLHFYFFLLSMFETVIGHYGTNSRIWLVNFDCHRPLIECVSLELGNRITLEQRFLSKLYIWGEIELPLKYHTTHSICFVWNSETNTKTKIFEQMNSLLKIRKYHF